MFEPERRIIDRALRKFLPAGKSLLSSAIRYSTFAGGKRFRPALMLLTAEMLGEKKGTVLPSACAVEMVHTFTLIHDDLPQMDDSDLRRGKPTCHIKFGADIALLAGDALNTLAFKVIGQNTPSFLTGRVISELSEALIKVVQGQVMDLRAEGKKLTLRQLEGIHLKKTAALIEASIVIAAILSSASAKQIKALSIYGREIGLAFQIADDILDSVSTPEVLGKPTGADLKNKKNTYPLLLGLRGAKRRAVLHYKRALKQLEIFDRGAAGLRKIADFAVRRIV